MVLLLLELISLPWRQYKKNTHKGEKTGNKTNCCSDAWYPALVTAPAPGPQHRHGVAGNETWPRSLWTHPMRASSASAAPLGTAGHPWAPLGTTGHPWMLSPALTTHFQDLPQESKDNPGLFGFSGQCDCCARHSMRRCPIQSLHPRLGASASDSTSAKCQSTPSTKGLLHQESPCLTLALKPGTKAIPCSSTPHQEHYPLIAAFIQTYSVYPTIMSILDM